MMKKVKLENVPFGETFEVWGHRYTVLDNDEKGVLVLEDKSVCEMPFREDDMKYRAAPNDFRDSSVRAYLEADYIDELVEAGAELDRDILEMELDLKCTLGQNEYGTVRVHAGLLTLEQYGKYYDVIPKIDTPYWLATPWSTPTRSPGMNFSYDVWLVYSGGDYYYWVYYNTHGVRPALTLNPSLLVSVEYDENKVVEGKWHEYLEYLIHWAIEHSDDKYTGCVPGSYEDWISEIK